MTVFDEAKPEVKPDVTKLQISVVHESRTIKFAVKPTQKLEKVFNAAATQLNMDPSTLKFMYNGQRVNANDTPEQLEMEDDDQIDANLQQIGGGMSCA